MFILFVLGFNNCITLQYGTLAYSSGTIGAGGYLSKEITFPITFTEYCIALSHTNSNSFTCCTQDVTLSTSTFGYSNKNRQNSTSFSTIRWFAIGY